MTPATSRSGVRPYAAVVDAVRQLPPEADREHRMRVVADALWDALQDRGVSWVGFYLPDPDTPDQLVLGPMRDKPACSPIGLHGMCGVCYRSKAAALVDDVATLGEGYVACDPRDLSEVVAPVLDNAGECFAVLDLDSFDKASFNEEDVIGLIEVLIASGLTTRGDLEIVRY